MSNRSSSGFTLIELLVVISIIGYLSTVVLASVTPSRMRARDINRIADMRQVINALELWNNDHGRYPCHSLIDRSDNADKQILKILFDQGYISKAITDPINSLPLIYGYVTFKDSPSPGAPCGQIVQLNIDFEHPQSQCPFGGRILSGRTHCHILYPHPLLCNDPFVEHEGDWPLFPLDYDGCTALYDTGPNDY